MTLPAEGEPRTGGVLRFALQAETDGWNPAENRWAGDGTQVGFTIFDALAAYASDGTVQPYLAESFEPNEDFTEWVIELRPDISFHNGQPLDAEAVVKHLEAVKASPLTGGSLAPVEEIAASDPLTVTVGMSSPWSAFPVLLTGQAGAVAAPAQHDDPDGSRNPIGTGPFRFVSWRTDEQLVVERNPEYWRTDESGQQLPYLDRIEFRPITDPLQRARALELGEVDMTASLTNDAAIELRSAAQDGEVQVVEQEGQTEVSFVMLNLAAPPFDDPQARLAVAQATDSETWAQVLGDGEVEPARTLFRPGTPWYSDIPIPAFDLEAARATVEAYEQENGPLSFEIMVPAIGEGRTQGEFLQSQWSEAGMEVSVAEIEPTQFLLNGVLGDYQAAMWAQFGSPDPDYEQVWWLSSSSKPVGELSLNFPRHTDEATDEALAEARSTRDFDERKAAYETIQERFAEDLPYIYLSYARPVMAAGNHVRGIANGPLPDGGESMPMGGPGSFSYVTRLTQTWLTDS